MDITKEVVAVEDANKKEESQMDENKDESANIENTEEPQEQASEEKNPFEGQFEIKCDYRLKYKDLFEGFGAMGKKNNKGDIIKKLVYLVVTIIGGYILSKGMAFVGLIVFIIGFYFLLRDVISPIIYRHKVSQIIAGRKEVYTVRFYPQGLRISEKNKNTNILYSEIKWKEYKNVNVLLYKSKIAIIPKRYLEEQIDNIMALAKCQLIEYIKVK